MDEIKFYCAQMGANDWKERQNGIQLMHKMALRHPDAVGANITKVSALVAAVAILRQLLE